MAVIQGNAHKSSVTGFYPKVINGSLRFNVSDASMLAFTPDSAGSRTTWTWSAWVKLAVLPSSSSNDTFLITSASGSTETTTYINGINGRIEFYHYNGSGFDFILKTNNFLRDPSAWYHLVIVMDTTNATAANRQRIYINGVAVTSWDTQTNSSQNFANGLINNTTSQNIGGFNGTGKFEGYMADVHFIDGQALTADDFGELKNGVWVAKDYAGTYGTNGFYLDFSTSGDGTTEDISGNGNNWTENNITTSDVVLDSPTNNFCTLNPINPEGDAPLSDGNLVVGSTTDNYSLGTMLIPSTGKWYFEATVEQINWAAIGIQKADGLVNDGGLSDADHIMYSQNQRLYQGSASYITYGATFTVNDVIAIAINMDDGEITYYKNNVSQGTKNATDLAIDIRDYDWVPKLGLYNANGRWRANFGQSGFTYTPPTDYLALSTANLPDPAIDPAQGSSPEDYFGTLLYSGTGSSQEVNGLEFQPDLVWIKSRSGAYSHNLSDAVRGGSVGLTSNGTNAEYALTNGITFDPDGVTISETGNQFNASSQTYVAWNWKANGSGSTIAAGSIDGTNPTIASTVSANTTSGFSIVSYTGNGTAGATIGHGLTQAPDMIITKNRDTARNWGVYHSANTSAPATDYLLLNLTNATDDSALPWNDTPPTSSVFTVGSSVLSNTNTENYIAYCFHSVEGYSKAFSYTGNGSSDGSFVYCGFQPSFIIVKRTNAAEDWFMYDNKRSASGGYNVLGERLKPNTSDSGYTTSYVDFLSNGFKWRVSGTGQNGSGDTYVGIAFASNPFKYSTAR